LRHLAFGDDQWNMQHKIAHQGTYNANPLSAAAGIAALAMVKTGEPQAQASALATHLVTGLNDVLRQHTLRGSAAYGDASIFHILLGSQTPFPPGELPAGLPLVELKRGGDPQRQKLFRMALLNHGVDLMRGRNGFVSAMHTMADIEATIAAFDAALHDITNELASYDV
jgi:glutamate-1-semialdehyde 2,1-aminomutase